VAVFVGGATTSYQYSANAFASVDIFDSSRGIWSSTSRGVASYEGAVVILDNSSALFVGGSSTDSAAPTKSVARFFWNGTSGGFNESNSLPIAARNLVGVAYKGQAFFAGGSTGPVISASDILSVQIYDPSNDSWSIAYEPLMRRNMVATTVGDLIYFAGGFSNNDYTSGVSDSFDVYDPSVKRIIKRMKLLGPKNDLSVVTIGHYILLGGGRNTSDRSLLSPMFGCTFYDDVEIYDTLAEKWALAKLTEARYGLSGTSFGTLAYFAGGRNASGFSSAIDVFDLSSMQLNWTERTVELVDVTLPPTLGEARMQICGVTVGKYAMFAGGLASKTTDRIDVFNKQTGSWSNLTLPIKMRMLSCAALGRFALFGGGLATDWTNNAGSNNIFAVDTSQQNLTVGVTTKFTQGQYGYAIASVPGAAYFLGGSVQGSSAALSRGQKFNLVTGSFSDANLPVPMTGHVGIGVGDKVIFAGGYSGSVCCSGDKSTEVKLVAVFANNAWQTIPYPNARRKMSVAAVGNVVIFAGGCVKAVNSSYCAISNSVDIFDATALRFAAYTNLSAARFDMAAASASGLIFFAGGRNGTTDSLGTFETGGIVYKEVDVYNVSSGLWAMKTLSIARFAMGATGIENLAIFAGGRQSSDQGRDTIDIFDVSKENFTWGSRPTVTLFPLTQSPISSAAAPQNCPVGHALHLVARLGVIALLLQLIPR